jgi:hypothetical protein
LLVFIFILSDLSHNTFTVYLPSLLHSQTLESNMMKTSILRRAGGILLRQKVLPSLLQRAAGHQLPVSALAFRTAVAARNFSQTVEKVPEEDYYDGHLMADHLEYLDDMVEKTVKVESGMEELKVTYAQKRQALQSSNTSPAEIEALFVKAAEQKGEISSQIALLKAAVMNAKRGAQAFAVDSPDGVSDAQMQRDFQQVSQIINQQAKSHEVASKINQQHKIENAIRKDRARDAEHDW